MTSPSHRAVTPASGLWFDDTMLSSVVWREVHPGFWVARCGGDPIGAIERVRTYVTTNVGGDVIGSYTTLPEAQSALTAPPTTRRHSKPARARNVTSFGLLRQVATLLVRSRRLEHNTNE